MIAGVAAGLRFILLVLMLSGFAAPAAASYSSIIHRDRATDAVKTEYGAAGPAAVRLKKTGTGSVVPEYVHADHLGSPLAASDGEALANWGWDPNSPPNGAAPLPRPSSPEIDPPDRFPALRATVSEGRESYVPFGATRLNAAGNADNTGFTGHLEDDASGLVYMQARLYDPAIGRFLSTDPVGYQDQLNLYAYVHNDPVNMVDPNGEDAEVAIRRNGFHAFVQITNKDNRLQTTIVRGGPNRDYSGASSGRSSGSSSGSTRGSSSSGSTGGTTGATAGGDSGDRASGSSSGDAGGSARLQLVGQVADIPNSIDGPAALDPNTVDVGSTTVSSDYSAVVGAAEAFTNTINSAGLPYQVLDQNSNSFAGTAFEQITGETRPENNSGGILPAYNTDLCKETQC